MPKSVSDSDIQLLKSFYNHPLIQYGGIKINSMMYDFHPYEIKLIDTELNLHPGEFTLPFYKEHYPTNEEIGGALIKLSYEVHGLKLNENGELDAISKKKVLDLNKRLNALEMNLGYESILVWFYRLFPKYTKTVLNKDEMVQYLPVVSEVTTGKNNLRYIQLTSPLISRSPKMIINLPRVDSCWVRLHEFFYAVDKYLTQLKLHPQRNDPGNPINSIWHEF